MENDQYVDLLAFMLKGEKEKVLKWVDESIKCNMTSEKLINLLAEEMAKLGTLWEGGSIFLPEVIIAVKVFETATNRLEELFPHKDEGTSNIFVLGTVEGDVHNLGKDIVKMVLRSGGIKVVDLGINVKADLFIHALKKHNSSTLGLSALMTTTLAKQREVINKLIDTGLKDRIRVIVGGAPVTQEWADKIGADAYGANAFDALRKVRLFME